MKVNFAIGGSSVKYMSNHTHKSNMHNHFPRPKNNEHKLELLKQHSFNSNKGGDKY